MMTISVALLLSSFIGAKADSSYAGKKDTGIIDDKGLVSSPDILLCDDIASRIKNPEVAAKECARYLRSLRKYRSVRSSGGKVFITDSTGTTGFISFERGVK